MCFVLVFYLFSLQKAEERKNWTKEQKLELKKENEKILEEYGYCLMDGHKQRVGNFKIEPPGLFRGRGDHPKMGKLKKRIRPEEIIINIGKYVGIDVRFNAFPFIIIRVLTPFNLPESYWGGGENPKYALPSPVQLQEH